MKKINTSKLEHTQQFKNLLKWGFTFSTLDDYLKHENHYSEILPTLTSNVQKYSETLMEMDKEWGKLKHKHSLHNIKILQKNPKLEVPMYVLYGYDDLTHFYLSQNHHGSCFKPPKFIEKTNTYKLENVIENNWDSQMDILLQKLQELGDVLGGKVFTHNQVATEQDSQTKKCYVKVGKGISLQSPFITFDLVSTESGKTYLTEIKSQNKGYGLGNLVLTFILLSTLELDIVLEGFANIPTSEEMNKNTPDYHVLKKFYKKFQLDFDKNGWGKNFTSKNLIGNNQYKTKLYYTLEHFVDKWYKTVKKVNKGEIQFKNVA